MKKHKLFGKALKYHIFKEENAWYSREFMPGFCVAFYTGKRLKHRFRIAYEYQIKMQKMWKKL